MDATVFDPAAFALPYARQLTQYDGTFVFPVMYFSFVLVEFMVLALLLAARKEWRDPIHLLVLVVTAAILAVTPLIRLGFINDFALKASIAPLFVLQLLALIAWMRGNKGTRVMIAVYLLVAGASGLALLNNFVRYDVASDLNGNERFTTDLACQHNRYLQTVRLNYLSQYLGSYGGDPLAMALLPQPRADRPMTLEPSAECAASIREKIRKDRARDADSARRTQLQPAE